MSSPASAKPWWWAQFTIGDGTNTSNSGFERWDAFILAQGVDATDTVYNCSYTWGTAGIGSINGINTANSAGLNSVSAAGGMPSYLIVDGTVSSGRTNALAIADADVTAQTGEPAGSPIMHIKDKYVAGKGWTVSSANHTSGGWDSQNNNEIYFRAAQFPLMEKKVAFKMYEMGALGNFHSGTYGTNVFYSPYGDTVELRYSPGDNDGTTAAGTGSLIGRLRQLIAGAKESIFYMEDAWNTNAGQDAESADLVARTGIVKVGCAGDASSGGGTDDWGATIYSNHQTDHTMYTQSGTFNRLHTKTMIFDMEWVQTGSPNQTASATYSTGSNDEAAVIIHDFRLARRYMEHFHKIMNEATADPVGTNAYDVTAPAGATGLTITPTDTAFYATWTASATTDICRYYLFIDTAALTQNIIGDGLDDDVDGYIDEDPRGDYDGFKSGSTAPGTAADDDADGTADEDLWMAPEVMVRGRASTSGAITTVNVGDTLLVATNYYFGIVSVDTQGNEGTIATAGPFQLGVVADTKLVVQLNSVVADTNGRRGDSPFVAANIFIRGETSALQDTLTVFAVKNVGLADSKDVTVRLWRDEDSNALISAADTMLGQLIYSNVTKRFQTTFVASDSRVRLGTTGKTFLVTLDIFDTAGIGDTFQAQIDIRTCSSPRRDSGPGATVTNSGKVTIVSSNQVDVVKVGDYASANIAKGTVDSAIMNVNFTVGVAGDTLQVFGIRNDGTMTSSDVSAIRLYEDGNSDSILTAADTLVASLRFISGSDWHADTIAYRFSGTSVKLIVTLSVTPGAIGGKSFQARVLTNSADAIVADTGPLSDRTTTAVFTIPTDTSPETSVVINEVFSLTAGSGVDPDHDLDNVTGAGDEQYTELYNRSDGNVDISGWDLGDSPNWGDVTFKAGWVMYPRQFVIVYRGPDTQGNNVYRFDTSGTIILQRDTITGTMPAFSLGGGSESAVLRNAINDTVSVFGWTSEIAFKPWMRIYDGADTFIQKNMTPGNNADTDARWGRPSPNATLSITASPTTITEGDSLNIQIRILDADTTLITPFAGASAALSANTGAITPGAAGQFSGGIRNESITISSMLSTDSVIIRAAYNTTTTGTTAITVLRRATVTATIILEARPADASGCTGTLANGIDTYTDISDAAGNLVFNSVKAGTYTLRTKEDHHLRRVMTGIVIGGFDSTVTVGLHRAGDVNNDNQVNVFDGAIIKAYKVVGAGVVGDVDGNAVVNNVDVGWARTNFGRVGE